jgi:DNA-binding response OmpR family regulator
VTKQQKILVIDDNEDVLTTITQFLTQKNFDVLSASNGLDALKQCEIEKENIDLIITDLVMPSISGVAIISIVKEKYPKIPIIAITGWGEHPESLAAEAKADTVMEKPFDLSELHDKIEELLDKR